MSRNPHEFHRFSPFHSSPSGVPLSLWQLHFGPLRRHRLGQRFGGRPDAPGLRPGGLWALRPVALPQRRAGAPVRAGHRRARRCAEQVDVPLLRAVAWELEDDVGREGWSDDAMKCVPKDLAADVPYVPSHVLIYSNYIYNYCSVRFPVEYATLQAQIGSFWMQFLSKIVCSSLCFFQNISKLFLLSGRYGKRSIDLRLF